MKPQVRGYFKTKQNFLKMYLFLTGGLSEIVLQRLSKYLEAGANVASYILANDNDVKSDFEVLSQLTSKILSSDVKDTELGKFQ